MFFVGAPLGAIIRKGEWECRWLFRSFLFAFWVLSITGIKLSTDGFYPPEMDVDWFCIFFLPIGSAHEKSNG